MPLIPAAQYTGAVNSDAVPKDLDRMIDAALDRGAEVLWDDAGCDRLSRNLEPTLP